MSWIKLSLKNFIAYKSLCFCLLALVGVALPLGHAVSDDWRGGVVTQGFGNMVKARFEHNERNQPRHSSERFFNNKRPIRVIRSMRKKSRGVSRGIYKPVEIKRDVFKRPLIDFDNYDDGTRYPSRRQELYNYYPQYDPANISENTVGRNVASDFQHSKKNTNDGEKFSKPMKLGDNYYFLPYKDINGDIGKNTDLELSFSANDLSFLSSHPFCRVDHGLKFIPDNLSHNHLLQGSPLKKEPVIITGKVFLDDGKNPVRYSQQSDKYQSLARHQSSDKYQSSDKLLSQKSQTRHVINSTTLANSAAPINPAILSNVTVPTPAIPDITATSNIAANPNVANIQVGQISPVTSGSSSWYNDSPSKKINSSNSENRQKIQVADLAMVTNHQKPIIKSTKNNVNENNVNHINNVANVRNSNVRAKNHINLNVSPSDNAYDNNRKINYQSNLTDEQKAHAVIALKQSLKKDNKISSKSSVTSVENNRESVNFVYRNNDNNQAFKAKIAKSKYIELKPEKKFSKKQILFSDQERTVPSSANQELKMIADMVNSLNNNSKIVVTAYAQEADLQSEQAVGLSLARAMNIKYKLVSHGIAGSRIYINARGATDDSETANSAFVSLKND